MKSMSSIPRLNFQQLLYLAALVEERHVTRAAERMGIGQPAMSAALARLRVVFRDPLLIKTTHGMEPTSRALELLRRIREVSDLLEGRGFVNQQFDLATAQTHWRVMASDSISRAILPDLMKQAEIAAPNMRFTVRPSDPRRVSEFLRNGDFDLAMSYFLVSPAELRQINLYPNKIVCIARRDHPSVRDTITLQQFTSMPQVRSGAPTTISTLQTVVDDALAQLGLSRQIQLLVGSLALLPSIVANSNLIAVTAEAVLEYSDVIDRLQVMEVPLDLPSADVSMLWHERFQHDPAHKWLRSTVRSICSKNSAQAS